MVCIVIFFCLDEVGDGRTASRREGAKAAEQVGKGHHVRKERVVMGLGCVLASLDLRGNPLAQQAVSEAAAILRDGGGLTRLRWGESEENKGSKSQSASTERDEGEGTTSVSRSVILYQRCSKVTEVLLMVYRFMPIPPPSLLLSKHLFLSLSFIIYLY